MVKARDNRTDLDRDILPLREEEIEEVCGGALEDCLLQPAITPLRSDDPLPTVPDDPFGKYQIGRYGRY
jgi:hypothetical protein